MDQDKKNKSGAPSSDTTSALFVSARKKQLEEQEAAARAKEKEEQRLKAEAEVRRLEAEVEERRRKAEGDAKHADEEAKRIAEEALQKQTQAAKNPELILGAAKKETKPLKSQKNEPAGQGGGIADLLKNKTALIAGGGAAAIILAIILIVTLSGGGKPVTASGYDFSGVWYCDYLDGDYDTFSFLEKGKFTVETFDGTIINGAYKVSGEDISCVASDYEIEYTFTADGNTLNESNTDLTLTRELADPADYADDPDNVNPDADTNVSGAPEGYSVFVDPSSGLQFSYPAGASVLDNYLETPGLEIATLAMDDNTGMLFVMNYTELYDEMVSTTNYDDITLLRVLANTFFEVNSETIFETADWATALGTKDFKAAIDAGYALEVPPESGRYFDTIAQFGVMLSVKGSDFGGYMMLTEPHDADLTLLNVLIFDTESDSGSLLERVIKSIRISPQS
jgi:hypothetical protein